MANFTPVARDLAAPLSIAMDEGPTPDGQGHTVLYRFHSEVVEAALPDSESRDVHPQLHLDGRHDGVQGAAESLVEGRRVAGPES